MFDFNRYLYGRGILFNLSSYLLFYIMLVKDVMYQYWHFGVKYVESMTVFFIK